MKFLDILLQSNEISYKNDFLEFYCESPFSDAFLLQMLWNGEEVLFFKNYLLKNTFVRKENNHENTKITEIYVEIQQEKGKIKYHEIKSLIMEIRQLKLPILLDCSLYGRDGHHYYLRFGDSFSAVGYDWCEVFVPNDWEILNNIAQKVINIQKKWQIFYTEKYAFTQQTEENTHTKTPISEQKSVSVSVFSNWIKIG